MVFQTYDGTVADTAWDATLYEKQHALYGTRHMHVVNDVQRKELFYIIITKRTRHDMTMWSNVHICSKHGSSAPYRI